MDRKIEFLRFILILGSLFLMAYAAFMLGTAWMDSVDAAEISVHQTPTLTPISSISHTPAISPTSLPLLWITPTNLPGTPTLEQQITNTPEEVLTTPTQVGVAPTPVTTIALPTPTPPEELPTNTPMVASPTASPTTDAYPGPVPTNDPYPGPQPTNDPNPDPQPTNDPYPGPDNTSTPFPTFTATSTGEATRPTPTPVSSLTLQPTQPILTPTPLATSILPTPTEIATTTLAYSESLIISNGEVNQVIWSDDALNLTLATSDGIYLINAETLQRELVLDKGASIYSVAQTSDDGVIAAGGGDAVIRWWDSEFEAYLGFLQGHRLGVNRLRVPYYGGNLISGSDDATVRVWDISTLYNLGVEGIQLTFTFYEPQNRVTDLAVSDTGELIAASSNQHVHIWNPRTGELTKTIQQPFGWYSALAFSPDGQTLITAYDGRRLEFWNTLSWERIKFMPLDAPVRVLSYSFDGNLLAAGFEDGRIKIWNARSQLLLADLPGHDGLTSLAFSPFGDQLATSSSDGTIRIWDVAPIRNP